MNQKQSYHHGELRDTLLKVAEQLLEKQGVTGLSLRKVSRAANVSHAAPYRHFQDKAELLAELARVGFDRLARAMEMAERLNSNDPVAQLMAAGAAYVTMAVQSPELHNLMFGVQHPNECCELEASSRRAFAGLIQIIQNGQNSGLYRSCDTMHLAVAAWSTVHGLASLICAGKIDGAAGSGQATDDLIHVVCKTLLHGMLAK